MITISIRSEEGVIYLLKGKNNKNDNLEYVLPISKRSKITIKDFNFIFENIEENIEKLLISIVDNDGSILCYYIYKGIK